MTDTWQCDKCERNFVNIRERIELARKIRNGPTFDPQIQFYPADLFILVGFDFKGQPVWERNPLWHDEDGFYTGRTV
jgi:hypothetical protein